MHTVPAEPSSFPYSLCLTLLKDLETLVEVVAQHYYGDDQKWNFLAVTEATKALVRLSLLRNSGYKMLLHGGETANDEKGSNNLNQQRGHGHLVNQGRYGNFNLEGRAMSALNRFGENDRMVSDPTWFRRVQHQHAMMEPPALEIKRPSLLSFLSEKGLPGGLFMMGEVMFITRPLIYVLLIRKYRARSWFPWFFSLSMDLIGMSSYVAMSWTGKNDRHFRLSKPENDELRRRKLLWALYLMREPCFSKYTWQRLESTEKTLEPVPVIGFLAAKLIELLVGAQTRYTYMSGS